MTSGEEILELLMIEALVLSLQVLEQTVIKAPQSSRLAPVTSLHRQRQPKTRTAQPAPTGPELTGLACLQVN